MGKPVMHSHDITQCVRRTWGTETSKYPEEKKTIVIPQVVASERGAAQTIKIQVLMVL